MQTMPGFNSAKWLVILTVIVILMNSCVSNQKTTTAKKGIPGKNAISPASALDEEKASALEIPSNPENVAFIEVTGFNEYVIGPGDLLTITEWKAKGATVHPLSVRPDGKVSFSFFEDIKVAGLTPTQVDDLITSQLEGFVKNPRIDVFVKEYRSKKVSFFGEINRVSGTPLSGPGIYPLKGKMKLSELLLEAGSETERADLKNVEFIRRGRLYKLNLLSAMRLEDLSQDVLVENGDKITIPLLPQYKKEKESEKRIYVFGSTGQQGWVPFTDKSTTISKALAGARGAKLSKADIRHIKVIRGTSENPVFININYKKFLKKGDITQDIKLYDGDIVFVPRSGLTKAVDISQQIGQVLGVILSHPDSFREKYTTGGGLRMETDVDEKSLAENERLGGFSGSNP
jgi:polysaccharide biosynthesis/export protein